MLIGAPPRSLRAPPASAITSAVWYHSPGEARTRASTAARSRIGSSIALPQSNIRSIQATLTPDRRRYRHGARHVGPSPSSWAPASFVTATTLTCDLRHKPQQTGLSDPGPAAVQGVFHDLGALPAVFAAPEPRS